MNMKALKVVGIILLVLIGLPLVLALFVSNDFSYEQSILINAPVEEVWANTNTLKKMDAWSPWTAKDPELSQTFEGSPGAVGEKNCWDSQSEAVGAGCQTITKVEAPYLLASHLDFSRPNEAEGEAYIRLKATENGTEVSWAMESSLPYPINLLNLIMPAEKAMGPDFTAGLNKLKSIVES